MSDQRVPPQDLDAEAAVLSAVLLERSAIDQVGPLLKPTDFYSEANRRIYEAAIELATTGAPIDLVTVAGRLRETDRLNQVGGSPYLVQLVDSTPSVANVEYYAATVRDKAVKREVIAKCQLAVAEGYQDIGSAADYADRTEQAIYDVNRAVKSGAPEKVGEVARRVIQEITDAANRGERVTGRPTGFERYDAKTAGLHNGDLTVIAARPGMGKTSFVLNLAVNVASPTPTPVISDTGETRELPGLGVAVFSLEMPREQLASRMVCAEGRVDVGKLRQGMLQDRDWGNLTQAASFLYRLPIWIDDTPSLGVLEIRAKVRRLQAEYERNLAPGTGKRIGLVIVDYLQLMSGHGSSREQEISEISRGLKRLAKELNVPVVALSQLNRSVETRGSKDKRPLLSDLRESGAIEQDADNVVFIYRDDYYDADAETKGTAELIIAKQRNGPVGKVKVRWDPYCTRFDNLAAGQYEGEDDAA